MTSEVTAQGGAPMATDTLFTLRMFPAQSEEEARAIAAEGGATQGGLELRILPVDAAGQVITVTDPAEVERVMLDLHVLPAAAEAAEDTNGHQLLPQRPRNPDPRPMAPGTVWQLGPNVALRLPGADLAPADDQDTQGFIWTAVYVGAGMGAVILAGAVGYGFGYHQGVMDGIDHAVKEIKKGLQ